MSQILYKQAFPSSVKDLYSPYDAINIDLVIPDGMEAIRGSFNLQFDVYYKIGGNFITNAQQVLFDNYGGAANFIDNVTLKMGDSYTENNFLYYSQYVKLVNELSYSVDELSNNSKHQLELRSCDPTQSKEYFRVEDGWVSAAHKLMLGLNRTNRNFSANDVGRIELKFKFKDRTQACYGASIGLANSVLQFRNVKLVYQVRPIKQTGLLTMNITSTKRYDIATGNAYFEYDCPIPTRSISSYFSTQADINANSMSSIRPVITELVYTFDNSNLEKLSYTLDNDQEILTNFQYSLLGDGVTATSCMTVPRLNSATDSTYGIGISFDGIQPAGKKIGVQLLSDSSNVNPRLLYTFFNGVVELKQGDLPDLSETPMVMSIPLEFGQRGDMMQTYELMPKYHSAQRTEFIFPSNYTVLSDLRLVGLTPTTYAGILQFATGLGGMVKNIYLYADGKIQLSGVNQQVAARMFAFKKLQQLNRKNKELDYMLDGRLWGFTNRQQLNGANAPYVQDEFDGMNRSLRHGSFEGRLDLKDFLPILDQCEYLRFKELKLVIEWNSPADVWNQATVGNAVVIPQPTLLYDRVTPDRAYSEVQFWDLEVDTLTQDAVGAGATKPTNYEIQGFNGKTIGNILVMNYEIPNGVIGKFQSHAQRGEVYRFVDDSSDLDVYPSTLSTGDMEKLCLDAYGPLNVPMLTDKWSLQVGPGGNEGDAIMGARLQEILHTQAWKAIPLRGRRLKRFALKYTRTDSDGGGQPEFTQIFVADVLKQITFDNEGKAVVAYV